MKNRLIVVATLYSLLLSLSFSCKQKVSQAESDKFASFVVNPKVSKIEFFWKDDDGRAFKSIQNLKSYFEKKGRRLRFAMNGGMYEKGNIPKGLFIQNQQMLRELDTQDGDGNFYLRPNGVFYLTTDNTAVVAQTSEFENNGEVKFATQSGPMLIDGDINERFAENSANLNIRNGVCVLPDNQVVFAISRREVSFYEFARYFKNRNCRDALYLDGFVSRMYLPEENIEQPDGDFAVIIGVSE